MSFMKHLNSRLTTAEQCFIRGEFVASESGAIDVLRDLVSLESSASRLLTQNHHQCQTGCICQAAIVLLIQCAYELQKAESYVREEVVERYYESVNALPYAIFNVWIQYQLAHQRYESCCEELKRYIETQFNEQHQQYQLTHPQLTQALTLMPPTIANNSFDLSSSLLPSSTHASSELDQQYLHLMELLLFHVLVPLRAYRESIKFLKLGQDATTTALPPTSINRTKRIPNEVKERWIEDQRALQEFGISDPFIVRRLAIEQHQQQQQTNQLLPGAPKKNEKDLVESTTPAFHANLAALHDTLYYPRLPPAVLPTTEVRQQLADGGATSESSNLQSASDVTADQESLSIFDVSTALIPFPEPFEPILPPFLRSSSSTAASPSTTDPTAASTTTPPPFDLSRYIDSLGHRLYALTYRLSPIWSNRARLLTRSISRAVTPRCQWVWSKRQLILTALYSYLLYRLLRFLMVYFRLSDSPAIMILVNEVRKFIKIAFITGTGQSLFG